ncbi:MAG TPA: hypothetical protein VGL88_06375 [Pseudonocardiaceae bacterium]
MSAALPEGVFHLLTADDDVTSSYLGYVTVCGEVVIASDLPPSSCSPEGPEREPRYCPACVREAARWSAEVGDRVPEAVNCPPGIYARTAR